MSVFLNLDREEECLCREYQKGGSSIGEGGGGLLMERFVGHEEMFEVSEIFSELVKCGFGSQSGSMWAVCPAYTLIISFDVSFQEEAQIQASLPGPPEDQSYEDGSCP